MSDPTSHNALTKALTSSFVDNSFDSDPSLRVRLLANAPTGGTKVMSVLEKELQECERFDFSVAFVTRGGITPLLLVLQELEKKGVPGRILTSDYLQFTEPEALEKLASLQNVEVKLFRVNQAPGQTGFHTKGYIFRRGGLCRIIVGSSNLTQSALSTNQEWNARLVSTEEGEFARQIHTEFEALWRHPASLPLSETLPDYRVEYEQVRQTRREFFTPSAQGTGLVKREIVPNAMQKRLAANALALMQNREDATDSLGPKRGLLISATGTGKTYASAFVAQAIVPNRILFLVHRDQIARKSKESYERILGEAYTYGIFIGDEKDIDKRAVFSTVQTMRNHLNDGMFAKNAFDLIVIDEVHHAGADTYRRIMDYFCPKLWFGMTATPDRPDEHDIYELFDHNILGELRLQQALENDMLCPFHYFGLTGLSVNDQDYAKKDLKRLASDDRVDHILRQSRYFGASGSRIKALVFCSSVEEAQTLSEKFNQRGARSAYLIGKAGSGRKQMQERRLTCDRLEVEDGPDALDYLFSVDLLNEGFDLPAVNQVILLRPTESPIVFVQQIGRGLRKHEDKDYVVILDFIGQCEKNFLIPMALTGDRSYNKENMRRAAVNATALLAGPSSVHFDAVARERIYRAIDSARTNNRALLRQAYKLLRFELGRIPTLVDFVEHGSVDPIKIFEVCKSYHRFLAEVSNDQTYTRSLSDEEDMFLTYLTERLGNAKRLTEALVLESIAEGLVDNLKAALTARLIRESGAAPSARLLKSCELILTSRFWRTKGETDKNAECAVIETDDAGEWRVREAFARVLKNPDFAEHLNELLAFVKNRYRAVYQGGDHDTQLKLYERYTYEDVCRLLNWEQNMTAQNIGGYFYDKVTKTLPVFVNYEKSDGAIAYEDRFVSETHLVALSKTKRSVTSPDAAHIFKRHPEDAPNKIYLFVRKNKDDKEAKSFYFLGEINAQDEPIPVELADGQKAFEINYRLREPVREDIYAYLTN